MINRIIYSVKRKIYNIAWAASKDFYNQMEKDRISNIQSSYNFPSSVRFGKNVNFLGNIQIGENTYINSGFLNAGNSAKIVIGEWCAIGYNVNIIASTHDPIYSTGPSEERPIIEGDIIIGNHVWIGTNVFIKENITIGNNSIIGANSVVTKNVPEGAIVAGVPARILKYKNEIERL